MTATTASLDTAEAAAADIVARFIAYNDEFREITRRARRTFEQRGWTRNLHDQVERIELYDHSVAIAVEDLRNELGDSATSRELWHEIRGHYARLIADFDDSEFYKTFFSSITRRVFDTIGVDPDVEFIALDVSPTEHLPDSAELRGYQNRGTLRWLFDQILADYNFAAPYRDIDRTVRFIGAEVEAYCESLPGQPEVERVEMLVPVFYRSTRAYLVGRIIAGDTIAPLVIALKNTDDGIVTDAVMLSTDDISMLFSFTRTYFHTDIERVGTTVGFLRSIMPGKPVDEIYTVLGRAKQGKTERYSAFFRHLESSKDLFERARGDKGMVMEVFTLPSYELVFKVIRDRFAYPKTTVRADVMAKYQLVFKRDRVGRLVDAQEFRRLRFPRDRFQPDLLEELLSECAQTCRIENDDVVIEHLYIERRLTPLNLYLQDASESEARAAAIEYGQAIRDLAMSDIFAGDLLLKNFGVTRHGRVIFYDYDELCLVTECNFRRMPEANDDIDEMRPGAWFYVGPHDVFPEQFVEFLGFSATAREAFLKYHGDLLTPEYWTRLKARLAAGEVLEVLPYSVRNWTEHKGTSLVPAYRPD